MRAESKATTKTRSAPLSPSSVTGCAGRPSTGRPIAVVAGPRRAGDPPELVADAGLAGAELGWRTRSSDIGTIVRTAWDWHLRHHSAAGLQTGIRIKSGAG